MKLNMCIIICVFLVFTPLGKPEVLCTQSYSTDRIADLANLDG